MGLVVQNCLSTSTVDTLSVIVSSIVSRGRKNESGRGGKQLAGPVFSAIVLVVIIIVLFRMVAKIILLIRTARYSDLDSWVYFGRYWLFFDVEGQVDQSGRFLRVISLFDQVYS